MGLHRWSTVPTQRAWHNNCISTHKSCLFPWSKLCTRGCFVSRSVSFRSLFFFSLHICFVCNVPWRSYYAVFICSHTEINSASLFFIKMGLDVQFDILQVHQSLSDSGPTAPLATLCLLENAYQSQLLSYFHFPNLWWGRRGPAMRDTYPCSPFSTVSFESWWKGYSWWIIVCWILFYSVYGQWFVFLGLISLPWP